VNTKDRLDLGATKAHDWKSSRSGLSAGVPLDQRSTHRVPGS